MAGNTELASLKAFGMGKRVTLLPHLDRWMQGDRHGEIVGVSWMNTLAGRINAFKVKLDTSGQVRKFFPNDLEFH